MLLNFCFHTALTFAVFAGGINRIKYPIICQAVSAFPSPSVPLRKPHAELISSVRGGAERRSSVTPQLTSSHVTSEPANVPEASSLRLDIGALFNPFSQFRTAAPLRLSGGPLTPLQRLRPYTLKHREDPTPPTPTSRD